MEIKEQIQQKINNDPAFSAALKEARNAEEALKALLAAGFNLTGEDLKGMKKADGAALSDDDLDKVAGGVTDRWWIFW